LLHESGEWVSGCVPLIFGDEKGLKPMQSFGSAWTYARRYGLAAAVGVIAEDDDGHSAGYPRAREESPAFQPHRPAATPPDFTPEPAPPAAEPTDPAAEWRRYLHKLLGRWSASVPESPKDDERARSARIVNDLITRAIRDGKVRPDDVLVPSKDGAGEVRGRRESWDACVRLWAEEREWAKDATQKHLRKCLGMEGVSAEEAERAAVRAERDQAYEEALAN
jgi:hypothetical protein